MADFAKSIFGFGTFHKKDSSEPHDDIDSSQPQPQPQASAPNPVADYDPSSAPYASKKLLPKGLASVAPTTAVSNNSMVYGTTTTLNSGQHPHDDGLNYLNHTLNKNSDLYAQGHHFPDPQAYAQAQSSTAQAQYVEPVPQGVAGSNPLIITTDETGQNLNPQSKNSSQPKGKLKVNIIEAKNLLVNENSQPYVVCTFESSEFVTTASASYGKSPANYGLPVRKRDNRPTIYQRQSTQHLKFPQPHADPEPHIDQSNPLWNNEATFDVVGSRSELDISVYDAAQDDAFLGHLRVFPQTTTNKNIAAEWFPLKPRIIGERVQGSLKIEWNYQSTDIKKLYGPDDFEVLRLLGKGTFGQVYQVKKRDTDRIYAMKILSKKLIVKKKEIAHTIGERNILVRTSAAASPFIVGLKFSFQTPTDLYLVTDYMSGGELFWHLQKEGRFPEDRAKFYIAELVLALEHLHDNNIVYRDLKPENILLDANGHIALCDFGLSKANLNNDGTTNTFCGTTEYLAPEVLLDESGYTKMVDFWSLGVLIFEMCCGWSPFYAENTQQMYKNIAFGKVRFPKEVLSPEGRLFVKGLLNRNPKHRLGSINDARELRAHPFFQDIDWNLLKSKSIPPPFKPHLTSETDTSNFDPEFTNESTSVLKKQMELASTPLSPGIQANFKGFTYVDDSAMEDHFGKSLRYNTYKNPGSFIPGNPNLPPDEDVIEDGKFDEEDEMDIDHDQNLGDEEFVNGRFDL